MPNSLQPHGLYSQWHSPAQNTGLGSLSLLQGIFPKQGLNPDLPHCRQILYQLSNKGSPRILEWVVYHSAVGLPDPGIELGSPPLQVNSLPTELSGSPWYHGRLLEGTNKTLCAPGARRKEQCPHKTLSQTCLWVSTSLQQRLRPNNREGTQSCPSTKNWIKVFLSMAPPIRIWPSFPHSQSLPSGSFHKPLILFHQRADRMKTTITEN